MQFCEGQLLHKQDDIAQEVVCYFDWLLGGQRQRIVIRLEEYSPWLTGWLTEEGASSMVRPISDMEVWDAAFDIDVDKILGPNGFTTGFF